MPPLCVKLENKIHGIPFRVHKIAILVKIRVMLLCSEEEIVMKIVNAWLFEYSISEFRNALYSAHPTLSYAVEIGYVIQQTMTFQRMECVPK